MAVDFQTVLASPDATYAEGLKFFRGDGILNEALQSLVNALDRDGIKYTVIGGVALNQHGYHRFTTQIDLLLTGEGLEKFNELKSVIGRGRKFRTMAENVPIDIITSGEFPGDGKPKPVQFPEPDEFAVTIDGIKTISLEKLIELKLSSGISAGDRLKDLGDVQELIRLKSLGEDFAEKLDPYVREKYLELCRAVINAEPRDDF
jgi:hypothetical protein